MKFDDRPFAKGRLRQLRLVTSGLRQLTEYEGAHGVVPKIARWEESGTLRSDGR